MPGTTEIRDELRQLLELTTRIDERVKGLLDRQDELADAVRAKSQEQRELDRRLVGLEHRVQLLEGQAAGWASRAWRVAGEVGKVALGIAAAVLLVRWGIRP